MELLTDDEVLRLLPNIRSDELAEIIGGYSRDASSLRQKLAAVTAERDALHAELMRTPPTLEWLRERFGEPVITKKPYTWSNGIVWWDGDKACTIQGQYPYRKETRAAVLAAVATTSEGEQHGN